MEEIWKVLPDHPNYAVSNLGNVKNLSTNYVLSQRLINPGKRGGRYMAFKVITGKLESGNSATKTLKTHVVVAELFHGPRPPGMVVMHLDGDHKNNADVNLRYGTQKENVAHMHMHMKEKGYQWRHNGKNPVWVKVGT